MSETDNAGVAGCPCASTCSRRVSARAVQLVSRSVECALGEPRGQSSSGCGMLGTGGLRETTLPTTPRASCLSTHPASSASAAANSQSSLQNSTSSTFALHARFAHTCAKSRSLLFSDTGSRSRPNRLRAAQAKQWRQRKTLQAEKPFGDECLCRGGPTLCLVLPGNLALLSLDCAGLTSNSKLPSAGVRSLSLSSAHTTPTSFTP
jgi:hypothetical protein